MVTSLAKSVPQLVFDVDATADTTGDAYALPSKPDGGGWPITWQSVNAGPPDAISLQLLAAVQSDLAYAVLDTSTVVGGEARQVVLANFRFIKVRQVSRTSGTNCKVYVLIG